MSESRYKATLSVGGSGRSTWCVIFRHPVRLAADGKPGKRIRRGLGTDDKQEAQRLVDQANVILSDESLWTPAGRELAEKSLDRRIVAAFYDELSPTPRDGWAVRESVITLPSQADGYAKVQLLGTTGAGKTTLLRQLIGTGGRDEKFPSTSTAKTTCCDIEIVTAEQDTFEAVVSFLPKDEVRQYVEESVCSAILSIVQKQRAEIVIRRFLEHSDQRFRLTYILGGLLKDDFGPVEDDLLEDSDPDGAHALSELLPDAVRKSLDEKLRSYISQIHDLAQATTSKLATDLNVSYETASQEERDTFEELMEDHLRAQDEFHQLIDSILDDIESRFESIADGALKRERDWPSSWTYSALSTARDSFIREINRFSSNQANQFGRLLTPLVEGIRVKGPFSPSWTTGGAPKLVLFDGEGLGHAATASTSLSTRVTKRYQIADVIVLVDNATQPMLAAPGAALRSIASSGQQAKLLIAFTHFDQVKGDNIRDESARRQHVLASLDNMIVAMGKDLGRGIENGLKKVVPDRTLFFANIDERVEPTPRTKSERSTLAAFRQMLDLVRLLVEPPIPASVTPVYDDANLVLCVQRAAQEFREPWRARLGLTLKAGVREEPWQSIKALTRRLGELGKDEYADLRPAADLRARLLEQIRPFLETPLRWEPTGGTQEMQSQVIDAITREVAAVIDQLAPERVVQKPSIDWRKAYAHRGFGSTKVRSRDIESIYDRAAPIPGGTADPAANAFLLEIRKLIRRAIEKGRGRVVGIDDAPNQQTLQSAGS